MSTRRRKEAKVPLFAVSTLRLKGILLDWFKVDILYFAELSPIISCSVRFLLFLLVFISKSVLLY